MFLEPLFKVFKNCLDAPEMANLQGSPFKYVSSLKHVCSAYSKFIEDGWQSLSCDPKYGGQGMPKTVSAFFDEMLSSSSLAFKL